MLFFNGLQTRTMNLEALLQVYSLFQEYTFLKNLSNAPRLPWFFGFHGFLSENDKRVKLGSVYSVHCLN